MLALVIYQRKETVVIHADSSNFLSAETVCTFRLLRTLESVTQRPKDIVQCYKNACFKNI